MKKPVEIPVFCACTEMVAIGDLKPNPRNPNRHPKKQVEILAKVIRGNGWRAPITVSNRSGFIVKGHGRLLAARLLKVKTVPVDRQDYESDEQELADLVADNRIPELSEMDDIELKKILEDLKEEIDIEITGYTEKELSVHFKLEDLGEEVQIDEVFQVLIDCKNENHQKELLASLTERGIKCRALIS